MHFDVWQAGEADDERTNHIMSAFICSLSSARFIESSAHLKLDSHLERKESAESRRENARRGGKEMASEKGNDANCVAPPESVN